MAGIKYYMINDSHDDSSDKEAHVIVKHLDHLTSHNVRRALGAFSSFEGQNTSRLKTFSVLIKPYKRKVYYEPLSTNDDVVFSRFWKIPRHTATVLRSPTYLKGRLEKVWLQQKLSLSEINDSEDSQRQILKLKKR